MQLCNAPTSITFLKKKKVTQIKSIILSSNLNLNVIIYMINYNTLSTVIEMKRNYFISIILYTVRTMQ